MRCFGRNRIADANFCSIFTLELIAARDSQPEPRETDVTILPALLLLTGVLLTGGLGGVKPVLLPDVPLSNVLLCAALNPVTLAVAFWLGRQADQLAKILIAAFGGALAGAVLLWLGTKLQLGFLATPGRAAAGIFVAGIIFALIPAGLGYAYRTRTAESNH